MAKRPQKRDSVFVENLEKEYRAVATNANNFCAELAEQLNHLVRQEGVTLGFPLQSRVKAWSSIVDKVERLSISIKNVTDIQDLIGLRAILLFQRDIEKTCDLLTNNFKIIRRYNTLERLKTDQFGYASIHFVLEMPEAWFSLPTLSSMRGLKAEVQVRTLSQHIWAEASHTLQYKQSESVPSPILRSIYRVSALLETVDLEFERVLSQRDIYRSEVDIIDNNALLSDVDVLEKLLDSILPTENKSDDESYGELLVDLKYFGIQNQVSLKQLAEKHLEKSLLEDRNLAQEMRLTGNVIEDDDLERVEKGVFFTHIGLIRQLLHEEFKDKYDKYSLRHLSQPEDDEDEDLPF